MAALLALTGVAAAAQPAQASSRTVTLRSGPIVVDGYAVRYGTTRVPSVGVNGHITSMHARVVDRAGRRVPVARMMLHHITFIDLLVPVGTRLRWRFSDSTRHDVTVADGPLGFSSQPSAHGATFSRRLATPGVYKLFCSLHPVKMSQRVVVRP